MQYTALGDLRLNGTTYHAGDDIALADLPPHNRVRVLIRRGLVAADDIDDISLADLPAPVDITGKIDKTIVDAKGDLLVGTAADAVGRLPVSGTDGLVLMEDSTAAAGVRWTALATGAIRVTRPNTNDRLVEVYNGSTWSKVDYDSGWWDVSALLINGWSGTVYMRRTTYQAHYLLRSIVGVNSTGANLFPNLGWKFWTAFGMSQDFPISGNTIPSLLIAGDGAGMSINSGRETVVSGIADLIVPVYDEGIPTSLPGTLLTAAPA